MILTRPSALPAQAKSPRWEPGGPTKATEAGTDRHLALSELLAGKKDIYALLPTEEQQAVQWANDYIRSVVPVGIEILSETSVEVARDGIVVLRGTADVIAGSHLFDLKWVERNYREQMAAYALGQMQRESYNEITVHLLFGGRLKAVSYTITRAEAEALLWPILDEIADPTTVCRVSDYCGWCKHSAYCKVRLKEVNKVADAYELARVEDLSVTSPESLAKALNLASLAADWAAEVKQYCAQAAKDGLEIPGYQLKTRAGSREIAPEDINEAFSRSGLASEAFINACKLSITSLISEYQKLGLTRKEAENRVTERLSGLIRHKPASTYLAKL